MVEYSDLSENSRYILTNFSGSTGDAVISQGNIFLFVDGRYHEQADLEVDKKLVTVVKMKSGESFSALLAEKLSPDKTFAIVSKKVSQGRYEILKNALKKKNIEVKLLDFDPVQEGTGNRKQKTEEIDIEFTGLSSKAKIEKISKKLKSDEAILVTNLEEISYLLNLRDFSTNYSSKIKSGKYIISKSGGKFLDEINIDDNIKTVYVDKNSINAHDYAILGKMAIGMKKNYIKEMKSVKTKAEIEHYKKSVKRADKAIMATREFIEKSEKLLPISEYDIEKNLEENFYKFGAKSLSFKSIVAKGKNSALAHYSNNSKTEILEKGSSWGSLVLIDCGAYYEGGYATDCTRVFVQGKPSKLQKKVYTAVLKGFLAAFNKKITEKTTGFALDKAARKVLQKNAPAGFKFPHALGHGIGINIHEAPPNLAFSPMAKTPLKVNMCFTIEPGLYKKGFGGVRLENSCYLAKEKGKLIIKSFSDMCFEEKLIDFNLLTSTEKRQLKSFEIK